MSISVKQLTKLLQQSTCSEVAKKKRKPRRKRPAAATPGTSGNVQVVPLIPGRARSKRGRAGPSPSVGGEVVISRSEFLVTIKTGADGTLGGSLVLSPVNFPWLSNVSKCFERIRWRSCRLEYRPAVGANTDGTIAGGIDWGAKSAKASLLIIGGKLALQETAAVARDQVLATTPCFDGPVWQRVPNFQVPAARLQSRAWYEIPPDASSDIPVYDQSPGTLLYHAQSSANKTVGEFWVHYTVVLSGTRKV